MNTTRLSLRNESYWVLFLLPMHSYVPLSANLACGMSNWLLVEICFSPLNQKYSQPAESLISHLKDNGSPMYTFSASGCRVIKGLGLFPEHTPKTEVSHHKCFYRGRQMKSLTKYLIEMVGKVNAWMTCWMQNLTNIPSTMMFTAWLLAVRNKWLVPRLAWHSYDPWSELFRGLIVSLFSVWISGFISLVHTYSHPEETLMWQLKTTDSPGNITLYSGSWVNVTFGISSEGQKKSMHDKASGATRRFWCNT